MENLLTEDEITALLVSIETDMDAPPPEQMYVLGQVPITSLIISPEVPSPYNLTAYLTNDLLKDLELSLDLYIRTTDLITPEELKNQTNSQLIDIRHPKEYRQGAIPSSTNAKLATLVCQSKTILNPNQNAVIYCNDGFISLKVLILLKLLNIKNVKVLLGGYAAWLISGKAPLNRLEQWGNGY